jgi:hypothetical protein
LTRSVSAFGRTVGVDAAPEFMAKRNSEAIVNRGRICESFCWVENLFAPAIP